MVPTGMSSPAFAFYRLGGSGTDRAWSMQNCTIEEPCAPGQPMQFTNGIGFRGKFYALSLQGSLAVIKDTGSCFRITAVGKNRAVPSGAWRLFREYLVESNGDILLVFPVPRKSIDLVDDVEVFRLQTPKLLWVKVESLGDRALFLEDKCCMWVTASKVGCKKNCVYFTHYRVDKWWIFDLGKWAHFASFGPNNDGIQETLM